MSSIAGDGYCKSSNWPDRLEDILEKKCWDINNWWQVITTMTTIVLVAVTTLTSSIINKVYYYLFITQDGNNLVVKLRISKSSNNYGK